MATRRDPGPYALLFSVSLEHQFYAPGSCPGLSLEPSAASAALLHGAGCIVRATPRGLDVFYDTSSGAALARYSSTSRRPFEVCLLGRSSDAVFHQCTAGIAASPGFLPLFDSLRATASNQNGERLLHVSEFADASQLKPISSSVFKRALAPRANGLRILPPTFVVRVVVPGTCRSNPAQPGAKQQDANTDANWAQQGANQRYVVRLQSRATHWKYYLPIAWAEHSPEVVDLQGQTQFGAATPHTLGDGRQALTVLSDQAIALHARPTQRFQLRAGGAAAERVLVKRLPVASAGQFNLEKINGVRTLVSEIYVQR